MVRFCASGLKGYYRYKRSVLDKAQRLCICNFLTRIFTSTQLTVRPWLSKIYRVHVEKRAMILVLLLLFLSLFFSFFVLSSCCWSSYREQIRSFVRAIPLWWIPGARSLVFIFYLYDTRIRLLTESLLL